MASCTSYVVRSLVVGPYAVSLLYKSRWRPCNGGRSVLYWELWSIHKNVRVEGDHMVCIIYDFPIDDITSDGGLIITSTPTCWSEGIIIFVRVYSYTGESYYWRLRDQVEEQLIKDRRERSGHLNARISISLVCASSERHVIEHISKPLSVLFSVQLKADQTSVDFTRGRYSLVEKGSNVKHNSAGWNFSRH